jgi:hypothetical protein
MKKIRLIRSLKKFIFRYQDLVEIYSISAETIISDAFSYSEKQIKTQITKDPAPHIVGQKDQHTKIKSQGYFR